MLLGIDPGQWSRIFKGDAHFPHDKLVTFMVEGCGNVAPLIWLLHQCGFDPRSLRRYKTDVEAENERLKAELDEMRRERETITKFLRDTGRT